MQSEATGSGEKSVYRIGGASGEGVQGEPPLQIDSPSFLFMTASCPKRHRMSTLAGM